MKKKLLCGLLFTLLLFPNFSFAHFGMIIPDQPMVMDQKKTDIKLTISFSHPFEQQGMDMAMPKAVGVYSEGKIEDLKKDLKQVKVMGHNGWQVSHKVNKPGVYLYYVEPEPYFEKAEDKYIVHITKVVVGAFGQDEGYDSELKLKAEIIPLSRPFGLYAGNVFQGLVKFNGKPEPFCDVEVEYLNEGKKIEAENDYFVAQKIKTDANGIFTFSPPWSGWWGFAALKRDDQKLKDKEVEVGGVIWVYFSDVPVKKSKK